MERDEDRRPGCGPDDAGAPVARAPIAGYEHVYEPGSTGWTILLLHGTGAATHSWAGLAPLLAEHFRVVAPDLPGHGFTDPLPAGRLSLPGMAGAIRDLLRTLDLSPDLVVGHSAGAAILVRLCLDGLAPRLLVALNGALKFAVV